MQRGRRACPHGASPPPRGAGSHTGAHAQPLHCSARPTLTPLPGATPGLCPPPWPPDSGLSDRSCFVLAPRLLSFALSRNGLPFCQLLSLPDELPRARWVRAAQGSGHLGKDGVLPATVPSVPREKESMVWGEDCPARLRQGPRCCRDVCFRAHLCQGSWCSAACVPGPVLFWTVVILVVVLGSVSFVLCHRRACRKWIQQSEWMWPGARGGRGPCTSPEGLCPGCLQPTALSFQSCTSATLSRPSGPSRSLRVSVQMSTGLLGPRGDSSSGPWSGAPCLHSLARQ